MKGSRENLPESKPLIESGPLLESKLLVESKLLIENEPFYLLLKEQVFTCDSEKTFTC